MRNAFLIVLLTSVFHTCLSQDVYTNLEAQLQKSLDQIVSENNIPGITFSLRFDAENTINLASGFDDKELKKKLGASSRMFSGSVGKLFVSAIALKLIQEGKIDLNEKANKYLVDKPWFNDFPNAQDIKVINLLNHTSGIPRHLFQSEFLTGFIKDPTLKRAPTDCIQSVLKKAPVHPVGKGWSYSDTNYILLGLIIEKVTGSSFYDLAQKEILTPLKLDLTSPSTTRKYHGLSQGYVGQQNPFRLPKKVLNDNGILVLDPSFEWTGGGFVTNPGDLTKLVKFMFEGEYLNDETKELLTSAVNMGTGERYDNGYGLGTFIWSKMKDIRYGHAGFFPGYLSHVEYSKHRQYAIAIQINTDDGYPRLQQYIYDLDKVIDDYLDEIDERKIHQNFKKQELCWNNQNIECYMEAYATTESIQTASRGGITFGYDNIIGDYKKYFPKERMGKLHFDNFNYRRLSDNLYFVTGRFNLKFQDRKELSSGWFSVTMKRINGNWKMITDHSS